VFFRADVSSPEDTVRASIPRANAAACALASDDFKSSIDDESSRETRLLDGSDPVPIGVPRPERFESPRDARRAPASNRPAARTGLPSRPLCFVGESVFDEAFFSSELPSNVRPPVLTPLASASTGPSVTDGMASSDHTISNDP
jgi:hypothetical protein